MAPALKQFQLLEISIMSAQDLEPVVRKMKTYAVAWVHDKRRLATRIDTKGNNNPTWNDKFVFRVDEEFLRGETSAVTVEIYTTNWFRDTLVGTSRVLVGNIPGPFQNICYNGGMRCKTVQVRRPSGRPQGLLNVGVAVLDSSIRSMPLYKQLSVSAVGYLDLMGMEDDESHNARPVLLRSRSEKSSMFDGSSVANSSMVAVPLKIRKPGSMLSGSELGGSSMANGKASSVITGAEKSKPRGKKTTASSVISSSVVGKDEMGAGGSAKMGVYRSGKHIFRPPPKPYSTVSGSEVGPSPSDVAALMDIMGRKHPLENDKNSSVLEGWSVNESEEGLKSKLERWRLEQPPSYDTRSSTSSFTANSRRKKGHSDGGDMGLFSCFGNVYGYEWQCIYGKPTSPKTTKAKSPRRRLRSGSVDSSTVSY